jgi:predicted extracellular nuclease
VTATGPVNYSFDNYRVLPTKDTFSITSNRPAAIEISQGDVSVAAFNVLNYFNGLVLEDGTVTFDYDENRGAENEEEFALQQARIVDALVQLDADVVGLVEIENDGFGSDSAIRQLVVQLNTALGGRVYRYARSRDTSVTGTDAISNAIIYKRAVVAGIGPMNGITLPTQDKLDGDTVAMRNALVQRFRHLETGDTFAIAVNHFKSKGSSCFEDDNAPSELDEIQGSCNALRVSAAVALGEALDQLRLPEKVLIVGDLNSYSQEDPIAVLTDYSPEERGYTITTAVNTELDGGASVEVTETFGYVQVKDTFDPEGFSYYFFGDDQVGSLDHVLASPAAMDAVVDLAHWNINAQEIFSTQYDQALSFYNPANGDLIDFTAVGPYRSSDHDPVVVTLTMEPRNWWVNR